MNITTQRNILAITTLLLVVALAVGAGTGALFGAAGGVKGKGTAVQNGKLVVTSDDELAIDPLSPGQSVVGANQVVNGLTIGDSGGNDVVYITETAYPVAYGANKSGILNLANACSIPGGGFADVGAGDYTPGTKQHLYTFTFDKPAGLFTIGVLDWGDYLPFGGNAEQKYGMTMTAYNAAGEVVDTDELTFTSADTKKNGRVTNEFGSLATAGDACEAQEGQPGRFTLTVMGSGITRVSLSFKDKASMDPHVALWAGPMRIVYPEGTGTQGYWRNHANKWPVDELVIGGVTYNVADAIALMDQAGKGDKSLDLFAQYVAAKLNVLSGNDDSCIKADITAAEAWFDANAVGSNVTADSAAWQEIAETHQNLDDYNNGKLCAPHRD